MTTFRKHWSSLARWQKGLAVAAVLLVLYTLFGFFLLPRIIEYVLVEKVSPVLQRQVSVGEIRCNPFTLTVDIPDFAINDRDSDEKFVSFDALHADLEMASLFRLAVVLRDIQLHGPRLHIRLDKDGKSNFEDLAASNSSEEERTGAAIFPVIVEPFDIQNGTVIFEDETRGVTHTVDQINFHLPHFSSRKKDWEVFMNPSLSFHLNGAPFHLQGQTIPFHDSLKTEFNLELLDLSLPQYWAYAPVSGGLELSKGSLTLENKLAFEQHEGKLPTFSIRGNVTGRDIEMTDNGQTVFTAKQAQVVMDDISILNLNIGLKSVSLDDPFVRVTRKKDGSINWAGYFADPAPTPTTSKSSASGAKTKAAQNATNATTAQANATIQTNATGQNATGKANSTQHANASAQTNATVQTNAINASAQTNATAQATATNASGPEQEKNASISTKEAQAKSTEEVAQLLLHVPSITLSGGRIQFFDETTKTAFSKELSDLALSVQDLSTAENATSEAALSLTTNAKETITANATFSITPMRFKMLVTAKGLDVPSYAAYFQDALPLTLASAKTDAQFSLTLDGPDAEPRLEGGKVEIRDLKLNVPQAADAITLKRAALDAITLDLKTQTVRTGVLVMEEPKLVTSADKNGRSGLMLHLAAFDTPQDAPAQKPTPAAKSAPEPAWNVQLGGVNVTGAAVQVGGKTSPVRLSKFQVDAITLDTAKRSAIIQKIALGFGLDVRLLKNGDIDLAQLFSTPQDGGKKQAPKAEKSQNDSAWNARVEQLLIANSQLRLTDETLAKPTTLSIDQITLDAKKLSTDLTKAIPLTFSCRVEETGTIRADGDVTPEPLASKGTINLSRLPLSLATPYIADDAAVDIPSGSLNGRLAWRIAPRNPGEISGGLQATDLRITEARSKTEIGGFKNLDLQNISVKLSPLAVSVDQITLVEPRGSLVISPDGKSTIDRITPAQSKKAAPATAQKKSGQGESVSLDIKTVTVQKGKFSFADKSLSPQFASTIAPVDMTVSGISLDPSRRVQIDLSAVIDGSAPMTVKGWVAPLKSPVETNSTVTLRNLDLVSLSPYSSKFIAYPVTKGQLDWDMKVTTQSSNLAMGNAITARQLELGDKVDSPDAADVPVKLGLALLRDMSGNIAITLPVSGDLNDPKFSIGGIVIQAFLGLILKAVTSPFSLLGSLIPEGSPDLSHLQFPAGLATPAEETMTAMHTLADVLGKRPGMSISVVGHADPAKDKQALFDLQFLRKLQVVKYADLSRKEREQTTPEQLEITAEEYPKLLWEAYKDEPVEKDKNALGIHRDVPQEVQEEKLKELIRITDDDLIRLAASRAEFVKNYLVGELKVDPNRVFLGPTGPKALSGAHEVAVEIKH